MIIDEIETFLDNSTGFIEAFVRADTEADWVFGAVYYGLLIEEGNELVPNIGIAISEVGIIKGKYHVNIRLKPNSPCNWREMGKNWTTLGIVDPEKNAEEVGLLLERVTLIDSTSIVSPELRFL